MNPFQKIYQELKKEYGRPAGQWLLWCKRPKKIYERETVIIEAILTQRINWLNVEKAVANLKKENLFSLKGIQKVKLQKLSFLIKPAGFYKAKAFYLKNLANFILNNYKNIQNLQKENLMVLRRKLINLKGIGPETADSILLYGLDKPIFVIDEYTRRLVKSKSLTSDFSYPALQELFMQNLKKDFRLYQDFHALIVIAGKEKKY